MSQFIEPVAGVPMNSVADAVAETGGLEQEFFIAGTASRYEPRDGGDPHPTNGRWQSRPAETASYRTRILVLRPGDPADFNGTVIANWNNVSGGESFQPGPTAARLIKDGFAVVGVSAQRAGVENTSEGLMPSLKTHDPDRYRSLRHPGDDWSYDIFTQTARVLGPRRQVEVDPLGGLEANNVIATGGSQSGARLFSYVNGVQPSTNAFDAFAITLCPNLPCTLTEATAPAGAEEMNWPRGVGLLEWHQHLLRDDLDAPIIIVNSETEAAECHPNTQPDCPTVQVWEVAGTGHAGQLSAKEMEAYPELAALDHSKVSLAPVVRGAISALHRWVTDSERPFQAPRITRRPGQKNFERDRHGNALGGIRMPELQAPLATHVGEPAALGQTGLTLGRTTPFDSTEVAALWPDRASWLAAYNQAVTNLVTARVIASDDGAELSASAEAAPFPV